MGRLKSTGLSCLFVWILKYRIILSINHTQKAITGTSCLFNVYMSILSVHIITSRITDITFEIADSNLEFELSDITLKFLRSDFILELSDFTFWQ